MCPACITSTPIGNNTACRASQSGANRLVKTCELTGRAFVWGVGAPQIPRLRSPDFLWNLGCVDGPHAPFLKKKGAHAILSSAARQEIRVGITKCGVALPCSVVADKCRTELPGKTNQDRYEFRKVFRANRLGLF